MAIIRRLRELTVPRHAGWRLQTFAAGAALVLAAQAVAQEPASGDLTVQPKAVSQGASSTSPGPALEIIVSPPAIVPAPGAMRPQASAAIITQNTDNSRPAIEIPLRVAIPASSGANAAPFAIDEFQYQFLTVDGQRLRHNFPVEFVTTQNVRIRQELTTFMAHAATAASLAGSLRSDDALTRTLVVREYLRRRGDNEPAQIEYDPALPSRYRFNGSPVIGGDGGAPFVIGGAPVQPNSLERFPSYRDNQAAFVAEARIFQGQFTEDFKDIALLVGPGNIICSATLVAPDMVLSAAHCACGAHFSEVRFGSARNFAWFATPIQGEPLLFDTEICADGAPANWSLATWHKGDLALFKLARAAPVEPRKLAPFALINQADSVTVVGFGRTQAGALGFKYKADVEIATADCASDVLNDAGQAAPAVFGCAEGRELVAASKRMRDTCEGDSGGPALVRLINREDGSSAYFLAAVTSRSILHRVRECGDGGIYVRIDGEVESWLRHHVPALAFADPSFTLAAAARNSN